MLKKSKGVKFNEESIAKQTTAVDSLKKKLTEGNKQLT